MADALAPQTSPAHASTSKHEQEDDDTSDVDISHQRKKRTTSRSVSATHTKVSCDEHIPSVEPELDTNGPAKSASRRPGSVDHANDGGSKTAPNKDAHDTRHEHRSVPESEAETASEADPQPEAEPELEGGPIPASAALPQRTASVGPESDDEATVERMVTSSAPTSTGLSLPHIRDYLPIPFPHRHSQVPMPPPVSDPRKVTVVEWIQEQQRYLLDTMRERTEQQLTTMRQRNAEVRKTLEKMLRS